MSGRRVLVAAAIAVLLTFASSVVPGTRTEYQGWDCAPGVAACPRPLAAVGFPLPFIVDREGISPGNSAGLVGALLGMDAWRWPPFALDLLFWLGVVLAAGTIVARTRRR